MPEGNHRPKALLTCRETIRRVSDAREKLQAASTTGTNLFPAPLEERPADRHPVGDPRVKDAGVARTDSLSSWPSLRRLPAVHRHLADLPRLTLHISGGGQRCCSSAAWRPWCWPSPSGTSVTRFGCLAIWTASASCSAVSRQRPPRSAITTPPARGWEDLHRHRDGHRRHHPAGLSRFVAGDPALCRRLHRRFFVGNADHRVVSASRRAVTRFEASSATPSEPAAVNLSLKGVDRVRCGAAVHAFISS